VDSHAGEGTLNGYRGRETERQRGLRRVALTLSFPWQSSIGRTAELPTTTTCIPMEALITELAFQLKELSDRHIDPSEQLFLVEIIGMCAVPSCRDTLCILPMLVGHISC
jgi:hypothetical protein